MKRLKSQRIKKCRNYNRIVAALNYVNFSLIQDIEEECQNDLDKFVSLLDKMRCYIFNELLSDILNNKIKMSLNGIKKLDYLNSIWMIEFTKYNNVKLRFIYKDDNIKLIEYKGKYGLFNYD